MPVEKICDWKYCNNLASRTPNKVGKRMFCSAKCRDAFLTSKEGRKIKSVHSREGWSKHRQIITQLEALRGKDLSVVMAQREDK